MPVVKVWGLSSEELSDLRVSAYLIPRIKKAAASIEELKLTSEDVSCFLPESGSRDVVIEVTGLWIKPERTDEVRQRLAEVIGKTVADWCNVTKIKRPDRIECFIHPFDRQQGFWSSVEAE